MRAMTSKSMVFREIGTLIVCVNSTTTPTDEEWNGYLQLIRKMVAQERFRSLAVTAGGGPTSKQRAAVQEVLRERAVTSAVVTDAPLVRGMVTALGWFNPAIRSFALNKGAGIQEALKYLGVEGFLATRILLEVNAMQREVGTP